MINTLSILGLVVGIALLYLAVTLLFGMIVSIGENNLEDTFMVAWLVSVIALVIVSMAALDAKGYINMNESSVNTEIVEEAIDD